MAGWKTEDMLFLSTPSARRATNHGHSVAPPVRISIHALREEGDSAGVPVDAGPSYFYPRPPRGGRQLYDQGVFVGLGFLSTPSARRATTNISNTTTAPANFYPRPPRGGRRECDLERVACDVAISIHALREEGDCPWAFTTRLSVNFYPRPPRGGRRTSGTTPTAGYYFYPRPPRGGRRVVSERLTPVSYFYPRPPRGGRRAEVCGADRRICISIHALREEGDSISTSSARNTPSFLSTPSARRATGTLSTMRRQKDISIHALREEGDWPQRSAGASVKNFYPRPPRGGRRSSA